MGDRRTALSRMSEAGGNCAALVTSGLSPARSPRRWSRRVGRRALRGEVVEDFDEPGGNAGAVSAGFDGLVDRGGDVVLPDHRAAYETGATIGVGDVADGEVTVGDVPQESLGDQPGRGVADRAFRWLPTPIQLRSLCPRPPGVC